MVRSPRSACPRLPCSPRRGDAPVRSWPRRLGRTGLWLLGLAALPLGCSQPPTPAPPPGPQGHAAASATADLGPPPGDVGPQAAGAPDLAPPAPTDLGPRHDAGPGARAEPADARELAARALEALVADDPSLLDPWLVRPAELDALFGPGAASRWPQGQAALRARFSELAESPWLPAQVLSVEGGRQHTFTAGEQGLRRPLLLWRYPQVRLDGPGARSLRLGSILSFDGRWRILEL